MMKKFKKYLIIFFLTTIILSNSIYASNNNSIDFNSNSIVDSNNENTNSLEEEQNENIIKNNKQEKAPNENIINSNNQESTKVESEVDENSQEQNTYTDEIENITKSGNYKDVVKSNVQMLSNTQKDARPNGIYKLAIGRDASKVIEVKGADKTDNAVLDIWNYKNELQQKFYLEYQDEGYYKITAMHSGKSLTVKNNKITQGTEIVQYEFQGLSSQKWTLRDSNINGWIISPLSNPNLAVSIEGTISNGSRMILNKTQDNDYQMLYMFNISQEEKKHPNGIYKLAIGRDASKVVEVKGANSFNNANVDILNYENAPQQKFYLEYQDEGYYKITAMHTGKSLSVRYNYITQGAEIVQYEYQGLSSQKWTLRDSNINGWIISPLSNPNLAVSIEGTISNGSRMILNKTQVNDNQMLYMFNISKEEQKFADGIYKLAVGKNSSKVIEVQGGNRFNGATIDINDYTGDLQQKFYFDYLDEGYYKIMPIHTWKSISINNQSIQEGANIVQDEYRWIASQRWILRDSKKNGWVISPLSNPELALTIEGTIKNGAKLVLSKAQDNDNQMFYIFGEINLNIIEGQYGQSGLMHKGTGGQYLKYYRIGNGNKHLFLNFSIHGFEDSYYRDAQELTYIAKEFFELLKKEMLNDVADRWTVFVLPSSNPDGEYNGWTNNGPGRTTLYSLAKGNVGIDMNRCFPVGYKSTQNSRNYNGEEPLQAFEAQALRNCILYFSGSENIVIDVHGWLNETIGDEAIGRCYRNEFGINKHIYTYGNGYLINWARSVPNTRSMLLELPEVNSHSEVINRDYVNKFNKATMNLLRNF